MNPVNKEQSIVPHKPLISYGLATKIQANSSLKSRIDNISNFIFKCLMQSSLETHLRDHQHFGHYGKGDIVVVIGTSTSGKTSIIKALKKIEPDRIVDEGDLRWQLTCLERYKKHSPTEIEFLQKVTNSPIAVAKSIMCKERSWIESISLEEIEEAEKVIQTVQNADKTFLEQESQENLDNTIKNLEFKMFDDAFELSSSGKNVILDMLNVDNLAQHVLMRNFQGPMRVVLIYCPFPVLSSRMAERTKKAIEEGEFSNQRISEWPLMHFSELYNQKKEGQFSIERLTRGQVIRDFNLNFDKGIEADRLDGRVLPSEKELLAKKEERRSDLLRNLGFKEGVDMNDAVEITPKQVHLYHLFINSGELTSEEAARRIHRGTYQRY